MLAGVREAGLALLGADHADQGTARFGVFPAVRGKNGEPGLLHLVYQSKSLAGLVDYKDGALVPLMDGNKPVQDPRAIGPVIVSDAIAGYLSRYCVLGATTGHRHSGELPVGSHVYGE